MRPGRVTIGGAPFKGTLLAAIAAVLGLLLTSGCGYGGVATAADHADLQNGQTLFTSTCGGCHALQAAGTTGNPAIPAPNLDNAFAGDRAEGYANTSIENVVLDQIRLGSGPIATYTNAEHGVNGLTPVPVNNTMRPNILTGQNAIDVAAYVASVAATTTKTGYVIPVNLATLKTGIAIFNGAGCAGCHILKAAKSTGTTGPNLDLLKPSVSRVIHQVMVGGGPMPAFAGKLTPAQIQTVAQYVFSSAGK